MAKAGDEYQEIVGVVAQALDPGASVKVGQWVEGPDGKRDLDVAVRGTINGSPYFVQIECKDWSVPVGIDIVDALDSKRRDLGADRAILFSNSGFTVPALRKATRLGIEMASALKANDQRIKVVVERSLVAKHVSVESVQVILHPFPGQPAQIENGWKVANLFFDGLPVKNWISELSRRLIQEHEDAEVLVFSCSFGPHDGWRHDHQRISVATLEALFQCRRKWVAQTVREDVTLGYYDSIRRSVVVPNEQGWFLGLIDREAWVDVDSGWEEKDLEPNSFDVFITLLNPFPCDEDALTPQIDLLILNSEVRVIRRVDDGLDKKDA